MKKIHQWTVEEWLVLLDHIEEKGPAFCLQVLHAKGFIHRTESAVTNAARYAGLRYKGPRLGCFKPGHQPPNKGKKMSQDMYEKAKHTMFKKGQTPRNEKPIGSEVFRADGYWYVKVAEKKWEHKHRVIWEDQYGVIPKNLILVFKNGNPHDIRIENLELITRKEQVKRNRWGSGPSEYSLISGRAATHRLKKKGFTPRIIRKYPQLLEIAKAETLLKNAQRHAKSKS